MSTESNFASSEPTREIMEADWAALLGEAAPFLEIINRESKLNNSLSLSYQHIKANLVSRLKALIGLPPEERTDEFYHIGKAAIDSLKMYNDLLDTYPDFREKELNSPEGAYPELRIKYDEVNDIVEEMKKILTTPKEIKVSAANG